MFISATFRFLLVRPPIYWIVQAGHPISVDINVLHHAADVSVWAGCIWLESALQRGEESEDLAGDDDRPQSLAGLDAVEDDPMRWESSTDRTRCLQCLACPKVF